MKTIRSIALHSLFGAFVFLSGVSAAVAAPIGEIITLEGKKYNVDQFGTDWEYKDYYVRADKHYVPLHQVKNIARIDAGNAAVGYLVVLKNGDIHNGRIGFLFYEKVGYRGSHSGQTKYGYVPVMKDRGQDGLLFMIKDALNQRRKAVEISNPNMIATMSLYERNRRDEIALNSVRH